MAASWVGYSREEASAHEAKCSPTYESVCQGDGHTEALRLRLDSRTLSYEDLLEMWLEDPRVPNHPSPRDNTAQYRTAVWALDDAQMAVAQRLVTDSGKAVPVLRLGAWHEAEEWHQHFYRDCKDFPG